MKNNAKLSLLALSLALGTSMAYASDDIPVVPAGKALAIKIPL